ncbi:hypothetical protein BYT27DRAFT_7195042 [Phlegmacium glaucopus]|nr:hypothetical protein BYT27DRAFT_7195042 [Phlegmacium glaucopus]
MSRTQLREDIDRAYEVQSKGAARTTAIGSGLVVIANHTWPAFRRQTLAFKGFVISAFTISGLVFGAESALKQHETVRRREENIIRREARLDLARRGLVATETEIANWKAEKERQKQSTSSTASVNSNANLRPNV